MWGVWQRVWQPLYPSPSKNSACVRTFCQTTVYLRRRHLGWKGRCQTHCYFTVKNPLTDFAGYQNILAQKFFVWYFPPSLEQNLFPPLKNHIFPLKILKSPRIELAIFRIQRKTPFFHFRLFFKGLDSDRSNSMEPLLVQNTKQSWG